MQIDFIADKGTRNEDTFVVNAKRGLFAVFDGASSLVPYRDSLGRTGAKIAADIAHDTFISSSDDLLATALQVNQRIDLAHRVADIDTSTPVNRFATTVAAAQFHDKTIDILQNADSLAIVEFLDGSVSVPLGYNDQDLEIMRKWRTLADKGETNIRPLVQKDVEALRNNSNKTFGVLNGDQRAAEWLKTMQVERSRVRSILLITDGLLLPKPDPDAQEDWSLYISVCKKSGLKGLLDMVRKTEDSDPNLTTYPRYKIHDDATGIFVQLTT